MPSFVIAMQYVYLITKTNSVKWSKRWGSIASGADVGASFRATVVTSLVSKAQYSELGRAVPMRCLYRFRQSSLSPRGRKLISGTAAVVGPICPSAWARSKFINVQSPTIAATSSVSMDYWHLFRQEGPQVCMSNTFTVGVNKRPSQFLRGEIWTWTRHSCLGSLRSFVLGTTYLNLKPAKFAPVATSQSQSSLRIRCKLYTHFFYSKITIWLLQLLSALVVTA